MKPQLLTSVFAVALICGTAQAGQQSGQAAPAGQQSGSASATSGAAAGSQNQAGQTQSGQSQSGQSQTGQSGQAKSTPTGMQAASTATMVVKFVAVAPADALASRLIGTNVYNNQNEQIGEIEDLVIDNGKTVRAVVVGTGGFLGMGERYASVDPATIVLVRKDNDWRAVINTTREDLKNAPEFKYERRRR